MKKCIKCGEEKEITEFPTANGYLRHSCKDCRNKRAREWKSKSKEYVSDYRNSGAGIASRVKYRSSIRGRATQMLLSMKHRSSAGGWASPEFTREEVVEILDGGVCYQTGIPFDLTHSAVYKSHPFAPSPDRINSNLGYTKANTQWVVWIYNAMKSDFSSEVVSTFISALTLKQSQGTH